MSLGPRDGTWLQTAPQSPGELAQAEGHGRHKQRQRGVNRDPLGRELPIVIASDVSKLAALVVVTKQRAAALRRNRLQPFVRPMLGSEAPVVVERQVQGQQQKTREQRDHYQPQRITAL